MNQAPIVADPEGDTVTSTEGSMPALLDELGDATLQGEPVLVGSDFILT